MLVYVHRVWELSEHLEQILHVFFFDPYPCILNFDLKKLKKYFLLIVWMSQVEGGISGIDTLVVLLRDDMAEIILSF